MSTNYVNFQRVSVLGLGTMGHGIALTMASAGCEVRGYDVSQDTRENVLRRIRTNVDQLIAMGVASERLFDKINERVVICDSEEEAVDGAQFVTEAVIENLSVKKELFHRLESLVEPTTILTSNTSSHPISEISQGMRHPERTIVTHWFNPPHIIPVVEVVPGNETSSETTQAAYGFLERIGKLPVRLNKELPGFLVNRVQIAMFREIWDLVERGVASPEDIDRAIRGSIGLRLAALGPLEIIDYAGWDVTAQVYQNLIPHQRRDTKLPPWIEQLIAAKRFGVKSGQGVFEHPPEDVVQKTALRDQTFLGILRVLEEMSRPADE